jgi:hypothetical protein
VETNKHPSSFRDPSGYVFLENGEIYRRINSSYFQIFSKLTETGLYDNLVRKGWLIGHEQTRKEKDFLIVKPEQLGFITYPYEWCFSQIQDAALLTLHIHRKALEYGMILKDATAFNVQLHKGKPVFIDTLSFDHYNDGDPWRAYGQFCRHFLAPLLLMRHISPDLNKLQLSFLDGLPLETASKMLPLKTHFSPFIKANIHMHAKALKKHKDSFETKKNAQIPLRTHKNIIQSMINYISSLSLKRETEWGDYYSITNYDEQSFKFKENVVKRLIEKYRLAKIWDIGGNNGHFSRLIQDNCNMIICTDIDPVAVDENYKMTQKSTNKNIIPLIIDYTNPSPGVGFANKERPTFYQRIKEQDVDCVLVLALIHHLCISANCTFEMLAESFCLTCKKLLIEFIPPDDSWADKLLQSKREARSLFDYYNKHEFESVFSKFYEFVEVLDVPNSKRSLYLMERHER